MAVTKAELEKLGIKEYELYDDYCGKCKGICHTDEYYCPSCGSTKRLNEKEKVMFLSGVLCPCGKKATKKVPLNQQDFPYPEFFHLYDAGEEEIAVCEKCYKEIEES